MNPKFLKYASKLIVLGILITFVINIPSWLYYLLTLLGFILISINLYFYYKH